jgi:hypothetical protein
LNYRDLHSATANHPLPEVKAFTPKQRKRSGSPTNALGDILSGSKLLIVSTWQIINRLLRAHQDQTRGLSCLSALESHHLRLRNEHAAVPLHLLGSLDGLREHNNLALTASRSPEVAVDIVGRETGPDLRPLGESGHARLARLCWRITARLLEPVDHDDRASALDPLAQTFQQFGWVLDMVKCHADDGGVEIEPLGLGEKILRVIEVALNCQHSGRGFAGWEKASGFVVEALDLRGCDVKTMKSGVGEGVEERLNS